MDIAHYRGGAQSQDEAQTMIKLSQHQCMNTWEANSGDEHPAGPARGLRHHWSTKRHHGDGPDES